jgi:putative membrane protein
MKTKYNKTFRILPCLAMVVAQFALISAYAADEPGDNRGQIPASDYKFVKEAACGGMLEVKLGNMAAAVSKNTAVQQFGQRMANDHGKAGQDLAQIAFHKGATLPTELAPKKQKEVDHLATLSGPEFDKAYLNLMVKCHKADEKAFKKASEDLQDPDLKAFAATTLPMVQDHLKMAQDLDESVHHELSMNK